MTGLVKRMQQWGNSAWTKHLHIGPPLEAYSLSKDCATAAAELAALREEVAEQAGLIKRLSDLLNSAVNVLRGPPPDDTLWSFHDVAERAEALRARVAVLQAGHDRYEWLRRQNLATVNVLWRQAMIGGNRFDDLVDELRATESAGDGL